MIDEVIRIIKSDDKINLVSFDIFDTLIFRTAKQPADVFEAMYRLKPNLFPQGTNEEDWRTVRKNAETFARNEKEKLCGITEVTIDDIYTKLPLIYKNEQLITLEIECEKMFCFINDSVAETIEYIKKELGLRIVLVSDMYLSKKSIAEILSYNGFNLSLIDEIFVSNEYNASKSNAELFYKVLEKEQSAPHEMFHVGDNRISDWGIPQQIGIHGYHYSLISDGKLRYPFMELEEQSYKNTNSEIYSLRLISGSKGDINDFWFQIGAVIAGPFFTYATEWVIEQALSQRINKIRPLMREGDFISTLLVEASRRLQLDLDVEPLFISRMATFSTRFGNVSSADIEYLLSTNDVLLKDVFTTLNIEEKSILFEPYLNSRTVDLKVKTSGETSIYQVVLDYLCQESTIKYIREKNKNNLELLEQYLTQLGMDQESITVDVGWQGHMQNVISDIMHKKNSNSRMLNLLYVSKAGTINSLSECCTIKGFVGNYGSLPELTQMPFARIYELILMSIKGTTIGYEREGNYIVPKTKYIDYPQSQIDAVKRIQEGILCYQKCFYDLALKKPHIRHLHNGNTGSMYILERLTCKPLKNEAEMIGHLQYDQNFGADKLVPIIGSKTIEKVLRLTPNVYNMYYQESGIVWKSGLNSIWNSTYYFEQEYSYRRKYSMLSILLIAKETVDFAAHEKKKIILCGAGRNIELYLNFFSAMGALDQIAAIVDNDKYKQGITILGKKICPIDNAFETNIYLCTTVNKAFEEALYTQIKEIFPTAIVISYYHQIERR